MEKTVVFWEPCPVCGNELNVATENGNIREGDKVYCNNTQFCEFESEIEMDIYGEPSIKDGEGNIY